MQVTDLVLTLLLGLQADPSEDAPLTPKETLRMHLHGELALPSALRFDVPPLHELQGKCDIPGTLIDILEEEAKTPEKEREAVSAIRVLDLYWRKYPDSRIPTSLKKYCFDSDRPLSGRNEALQKRGLMAGPDTPAFYAEVFRSIPELAGPLVSWLRATVSGTSPKWMSIRELYTPEVRSALVTYIEGQLRVPSPFPEDRKMYQILITDLDREAGLISDPGVNGGDSRQDPPAPPRAVATPGGSGIETPSKAIQKVPVVNPKIREFSRAIIFAGLSIGVVTILLYRFLRRK